MRKYFQKMVLFVLPLMLFQTVEAGYRAESTDGSVRIPNETDNAIVSVNCHPVGIACRLEVMYTVRVNVYGVSHTVYIPAVGKEDKNFNPAGMPVFFHGGYGRLGRIDDLGPVVVSSDGEKIAFTAEAGLDGSGDRNRFSVVALINSADVPTLSANLRAGAEFIGVPLALYVPPGRAGWFEQMVISPDGDMYALYEEVNVVERIVSPPSGEPDMPAVYIDDPPERLVQLWRVSSDGLGPPMMLAENEIGGVFMDENSKMIPGRNGSLTIVVGVGRAFQFNPETWEWIDPPILRK